MIVEVAVPVPLRKTFDFIVEKAFDNVVVGARVKVPFGARQLVGIVVSIKAQSDYPADKLRRVIELLDSESVFEPHLWRTLNWISSYYLAPIGEVFETAIPVKLRQAVYLQPAAKKTWRLTEYARSASIDDLQRAPLQRAILKRFIKVESLSSIQLKQQSPGWRQAVRALVDKGWLEQHIGQPMLVTNRSVNTKNHRPPPLNNQQRCAVDQLNKAFEKKAFYCALLHGVTGSGKTEVYFDAMRTVLRQGRQVLLLVPEIGLTPQLMSRIEKRFEEPTVSMHSGLNASERHLAWWHARTANAKIVVGTRSAIFASFNNLGLIIVDEEHDSSFKQQEGVRYHARDVAMVRAKQAGIPIVLGSATPSLESYQNAKAHKYHKIVLDNRATNIPLPKIGLIDIGQSALDDGLSEPLIKEIAASLVANKQALIFLNRRGYAPVLYCGGCRKASQCHRCDSNMTLHKKANRLRCHHCGYECRAWTHCDKCGSASLLEIGEGTQKIEEALQARFPEAKLMRLDRDSTSRKGELADKLESAYAGDTDILLGTQLLTKGHDFPNVALVGILNADQGLYSTDFRSSEVLFQQILQVAGRAGRHNQRGKVLIQTAFAEHDFFAKIQQHDFDGFAEQLLQSRRIANFPPFGFFALLRAESVHQAQALQFLRRARQEIKTITGLQGGVKVNDVIPAPMERRAGKYRGQLLISSSQRAALNQTLWQWLSQINDDASQRKLSSSVRWTVDIDPNDLF